MMGVEAETYSDAEIRTILDGVRVIAMVGASANPVRPSHLVLKYLLQKGYRVMPVNPRLAGQNLAGQPVYARLADIGEPIDMIDIFRSAEAVPEIVAETLALAPRPTIIWMQLGVTHPRAAAQARAAGLRVVMNRCPKIEYGRLSGEIGWAGVNANQLSAKRPVLRSGFQHLGIAPKT